NAKWIVVGVLVAAIALLAAFLLLRDDGKKENVAASSSEPSATETESSSSEESSTSSTSSSSTSSSELTEAEIRRRLLTAKDIRPEFADRTYDPTDPAAGPCGSPPADKQIPPQLEVGSEA